MNYFMREVCRDINKRTKRIYPSVFDHHNPILNQIDQALKWLNKTPDSVLNKAMRTGLHKTRFRLPKDPKTRKEIQFPKEDADGIDAFFNEK